MMKNRALYYLLNLTWGLPLTATGAICAFFLILSGKRPKRHGGCLYFVLGKNWGGLEMGLFFLTDRQESPHILDHEFGHSIQNALLGPLMIPLVCLPSALRYWVRRARSALGHPDPRPYDAIWFEGQAGRLGRETRKYWQ